MEISEVRVKLVSNKDDRLKAFCSITMDNEFVVRDIKVIEGVGGLFVAMPSRKMILRCPDRVFQVPGKRVCQAGRRAGQHQRT